MRRTFVLLAGAIATPLLGQEPGLLTVESTHPVELTADRLESRLRARGVTLFSRIDHAANAAEVGEALAPTVLLQFGNPAIGTPLMRCARTVAIDLPLKYLVWEADDGRVWIGYTDPAVLRRRHRMTGCEDLIANIQVALEEIARRASEPMPQPAGMWPELVQPEVISTRRHETFPAVDPVDGSLWFSRYDDAWDAQTIYRAPWLGDAWGEATVVAFSGEYGDRAPRFSPNGRELYFTSNRPAPDGGRSGDMNIWVTERRPDGGWSDPRMVPAPVSTPNGRDIHSSVVRDGSVYVASSRPGGRGRSDIYRVPRRGAAFGRAEHLGPTVNDALSQPDLYVSPDERWMVLVITDHPDGLGGDDLFLVRREGNGWGTPRHLDAPINSEEYEYGPWVSPDGQWLYFTSHRRGSADVYRVPVAELGVY